VSVVGLPKAPQVVLDAVKDGVACQDTTLNGDLCASRASIVLALEGATHYHFVCTRHYNKRLERNEVGQAFGLFASNSEPEPGFYPEAPIPCKDCGAPIWMGLWRGWKPFDAEPHRDPSRAGWAINRHAADERIVYIGSYYPAHNSGESPPLYVIHKCST
jgi:hypothetical protein